MLQPSFLALGDAQPAVAQARDHFAHTDGSRSLCDELVVPLGGNVVVIAVEPATGDSSGRSKGVKLIER